MRIYYKESVEIRNREMNIEVLDLEGDKLLDLVFDKRNLSDLQSLIKFTQHLSDVKYSNYIELHGDPCSRNKLLMCVKDWIKEYNPVMHEFLR